MLTIQILDSAGTVLHRLDPRPLVLGSGPAADIRLRESGVEPEHARIQPLDTSGRTFKIVDLDSSAGTIVNGESVAQAKLALGDRIELGRAVVVVGQQVSRRATPDDVLEAVPVRRSPRSGRKSSSSRSVVYAAVAVGVVLCAILAWAASSDELPQYARDVTRHANAGRFDDANRTVAMLRVDWADGDPERVARVDDLAADVARMKSTYEAMRGDLYEGSWTRTRAQQLDGLKELRAGSGVDARVAHILMAQLDEIRREAAPHRPSDLANHADVADRGADAPSTDGGVAAADDIADAAAPTVPSVSVADEVRALYEGGDAPAALARIAEALAAADEPTATELRDLRIQIRDAIVGEIGSLLAEARQLAARGDEASVKSAMDLIESQVARFERTDDAAPLRHELRQLRAWKPSDAQPSAVPTDVEFVELVEAAADARDRGAFTDGANIYDMILGRMRSTDGPEARRFASMRDEMRLLAALQDHLVTKADGGSLALRDVDGQDLVLGVDGGRLVRDDGAPLDFADVMPGMLLALAERGPREARLGAAMLAYGNGAADAAEAALLQLVRSGDVPDDVASVIARGRDDRIVDSRGYVVDDGAFVTVREREMRRAIAQVQKQVATAVKHAKPEKRMAELEKLMAEGPELLDAIVLALHQELDAAVEQVEGHAFRRQWDKFAERRRVLDEQRKAALALIFDTNRYFAPYKPPAVSSEKYGEYLEVQREVDDLVGKVRETLKDRQKTRVPPALRRSLERIEWLDTVLEDFGEDIEPLAERIAWARSLPADGVLTLASFCWDEDERRDREHWDRVMRFNETKRSELSSGEAAQVEITNEYRMMLGRRPLAVNTKLIVATRSHAKEMADLGYFSHYSPTPGRKTPFERMVAAGYTSGTSENLANHPSAASAHTGWTHSSGHHRNLLSASHREFAVGNLGKYWVQNFGGGTEFERDSAF